MSFYNSCYYLNTEQIYIFITSNCDLVQQQCCKHYRRYTATWLLYCKIKL